MSSSSLQKNNKDDGASSSSLSIEDTNSTRGSSCPPPPLLPPSTECLEGNTNDEKRYRKDILMLTSGNYSERSFSYHGDDGGEKEKEAEDEPNKIDTKISATSKTNKKNGAATSTTELVRGSTEEQASSATSHLIQQRPLRPGAFAIPGRNSNSSSQSQQQAAASSHYETTADDEAVAAAREPTVLTSTISTATTTTTSATSSISDLALAEGDVLLNAIMVDKPEDVEAQVRKKIIKEAVQASTVVVLVDDDYSKQHQQQQTDGSGGRSSAIVLQNKWQSTRKYLLILLMMVVVSSIVIAVVSYGRVSRKKDDDSNNQHVFENENENMIENDDHDDVDVDVPQVVLGTPSTMDEIRKRGMVRCGYYGLPNHVTGTLEEMNIEQCRAVALAIFNDSTKYEAISIPFKERYTALTEDHSIDLHMGIHTMASDVYESKSSRSSDILFSVPYLYTESAFVGYPEFVNDCADEMETEKGNCPNLRICVGKEPTHVEYLQRYLPETFIVNVPFLSQLVTYLEEGKCNVVIITEHGETLPEFDVEVEGYSGPYVLGNTRFTREPMSLIMRNEENPEFSDLVNAVLRLFIHAEAINLTQDKAQEQEEIVMNLNEDEENQNNDLNLHSLMIRLVAEFGNYGEIWNRTMEHFFPRNALNYIYENSNDNTTTTTMDSGLLFSYPFGDLEEQGPGPIPNGILEKVFQRGYLICGVIPRPGFAEFHIETKTWHGLDVEFCRALNAAIHMGETETVEFVDVSNTNERYSHLSGDNDGGGAVDVIAGERVTIQNDINELTTNMGYTFSIPYFYDNKGDAFAFVTNQSDSQWSDFVFWVVMATIYAEEEGISSQTDLATKMPTVNLFGQEFKQMFSDCIAAVGNYGEIYEHTLGGLIPRSGGNLLNGSPGGPQHFPIPID